jgi:hypothetical protein
MKACVLEDGEMTEKPRPQLRRMNAFLHEATQMTKETEQPLAQLRIV